MDGELEHLLLTYSGHAAISEQGSLREVLTSLRSLSEGLHLDFEEALKESDTAYQHRLMLAFDPGL
jgi:hypothetical protein